MKTGRYSISEVQPDRWDTASYYDADHAAPDKTYSKIGGWVREYAWDPMKWRLPIPPRVADAMDVAQKWAVACTREALEDYGYPNRALDLDRTAVILGNAMAGEKHYRSSLRVFFPEYAHELTETAAFASLPAALQHDISREFHDRMAKYLAAITEDTMPGELANCMAGRIANLYNFHGPNFVCDAACASAMAAISSAAEGLIQNDFDVAVSGGVDRNMGAPTFVKFCKIGALSATGTRPYAEGADGFVMGEGCGDLHPQAPGGCRARPGQNLRRAARHWWFQRRQRKRHYCAQSHRSEILRRARLAECRAVSRDRDVDRRPRHLDPRGRCGRSPEHGRDSRQHQSSRSLRSTGFGQIEHRTSEGRRRCCRNVESRPCAA